jgi:hypothetical protein
MTKKRKPKEAPVRRSPSSPLDPLDGRGLSFGTACSRKVAYESEIDALCGANGFLEKNNEEADWCCFKPYKCPECGKYHLTKHGLQNEAGTE